MGKTTKRMIFATRCKKFPTVISGPGIFINPHISAGTILGLRQFVQACSKEGMSNSVFVPGDLAEGKNFRSAPRQASAGCDPNWWGYAPMESGKQENHCLKGNRTWGLRNLHLASLQVA